MDAGAKTPPHPLHLYSLAVQHPLAEVAFVEHAWAHYYGDASEPRLLREDFAGSCAVAAAWVASDPDRQAMAVELDGPTLAWAQQAFDDPDLHLVEADVMDVDDPAVQVTLALNFSVLIYHDGSSLQGYLSHALNGLVSGGILIMDVFGGPGVEQPSTQARLVEPNEGGIKPFTYLWEQHGRDPWSSRIDCRIHFELADGERLQDAFVYNWRLWDPAQIIQLAHQAGFVQADFWWSAPTEPGRFQPVQEVPQDQDWVGYVVCRKG